MVTPPLKNPGYAPAYKQQFTIPSLNWFALIWPFTEVEPDILAKSRTKAIDLFTNTAAILN